jgi:CRP/FNR family transcriptional regulator, cyclic AMP receptor protein
MASLSTVSTRGTDLPTSNRGRDSNVILRGMSDSTGGRETERLAAYGAALTYTELSAQVIQRRPVDAIGLLQTHPVFGALGPAQIKQLGQFARPLRIVSGTTLFAKGDPGTALYAVVSGTIKIKVPSIDGREVMFNLVHAGEVFGEIALLDGQPRSADAIAATDCELIVIERRDFLSFVDGEPKVAMKLIELLCARVRVASAWMEEVVFLNLPRRLAHLLLRLLEANAAAADKSKLSITQQEISGLLCTTRESVNKYLQIWAGRGVIALKRGTILVLVPRALAALGSGDDDSNGNDSTRPSAKRN